MPIITKLVMNVAEFCCSYLLGRRRSISHDHGNIYSFLNQLVQENSKNFLSIATLLVDYVTCSVFILIIMQDVSMMYFADYPRHEEGWSKTISQILDSSRDSSRTSLPKGTNSTIFGRVRNKHHDCEPVKLYLSGSINSKIRFAFTIIPKVKCCSAFWKLSLVIKFLFVRNSTTNYIVTGITPLKRSCMISKGNKSTLSNEISASRDDLHLTP